ncbi:Zinc-binding alcohol dehydrogenase domain-containing protein cipB [Fusarium oxysporum f. sp. cubense race 1]|uniref:Zinc-binding alcohol dehydrogenase domain-containing protein cipB n=1 Tax=Fusarium oxysporum f. sp. cubense (strain race 1) TaxID=1229664 RepID=N4TY27_FUSC1|nr:Zinc-binding alcohol dehydrogenase domain-containing protein cipB [Fusarium oxysporum f. sp. cubense race 1]
MPTNRAAWIRGPKSYPLEVGPATFPTPKSGEVIIKAQTYALNPVEWKVQEQDFFVKTYPFILGADVAGYVEDVGEGVTHVQKGQRVMGYCIGLGVNDPAFGGFQLYPTLFASLVCPIPDSLSFGEAAVAPLAVTTAAVNLYHRSHLGLPLPSLNLQPSGKAILVWGGSSLNHNLVKSVGATTVLDYKSPTIVQDVVSVLSGRELVGIFDAISEPESMRPVSEILDQVGSHKVGLVVPPTIELSKNFIPTLSLAFEILNNDESKVLYHIWQEFLPESIRRGSFQLQPPPVVVGKGLGDIQQGLDKLRSGVSGQKFIVHV